MYALSSHFIRTSFAFFCLVFPTALLCVGFSDKRPISHFLARPSLDSSAGRAEDCSWLHKAEILRSLVQIRFERGVFFVGLPSSPFSLEWLCRWEVILEKKHFSRTGFEPVT